MSNSLSIIIPAYNEKDRIKDCLSKYSDSFPDAEIIVVCDGVDNTKDIVREFSNKNLNIKLLNFEKRLGKGGAIFEGFRTAKGDRLGFIDTDESVSPDDLRMLFSLLSDADVVISSRRLKESKILVKQSLKRRIASKVFNILVRIMFNIHINDTQCGAKVFRKNAIDNILNKMKSKGFEFDVELLWRLKKEGYNIVEYPITWKHSEGSSFSLSKAPTMFISLLKIRLFP